MRRPLALLVLLLILGGLTGCGGDDGDDGGATSTAAPTTDAAGPDGDGDPDAGVDGSETEGTEPDDPEGDGDDDESAATVAVRTYFVRGERIATGGTEVVPPAIGGGAIEALLDGPTAEDGTGGLISSIPEGTELLGLDIADGTATVDLSSAFTSGGGSLSMTLRTAQVVFTLTQFDGVDRVQFLIDGEQVDGLGGEGLPTSYDGREAFADVTPLILIESPTPGIEVGSAIAIRGLSNTFEANVLWSVQTQQGEVLDEGFTTATAGTGTWGTFEAVAEIGSYTGPAVVTAWEESMETGERINIYDLPIVIV